MKLLCVFCEALITDFSGKTFLTATECCMSELQTEKTPTSLFPVLFLACVDLLIMRIPFPWNVCTGHKYFSYCVHLCCPFILVCFFLGMFLDLSKRVCRNLF